MKRAVAIDLDRATLRVIRTVIADTDHTSFKPYPKSTAGRRIVPMPACLVTILREHLTHYPLGEADLIFANAVGGALHRTLFRSRVWRLSLVRAGLLGSVTAHADRSYRAEWTDQDGNRSRHEEIDRTVTGHTDRHHPAGGLHQQDLARVAQLLNR